MRTNKTFLTIVCLLLFLTSYGQLDVSNKQFQQKIHELIDERILDFQEYLIVISSKNSGEAIRNEYIDNAMDFFMEGAEIEVSSLNKPIDKFPAREYLVRLKKLNYEYVEMNFERHSYDKLLKEVASNTLRTTGIYRQHFKGGKSKENIQYSDYTIKKIDIYIIKKQKGNFIFWDIKFKNITVERTQKN